MLKKVFPKKKNTLTVKDMNAVRGGGCVGCSATCGTQASSNAAFNEANQPLIDD